MTWDVVLSPPEMAAAQAEAESLMTLKLGWFSPNGTTTTNGKQTPAFATESSTLGKVAGQSAQSTDTYTRTVVVGQVEVPVLQGGLHIPVGAPLPAIRWECVVTAVGAGADPALLGRRYRVVSVPAKSYATARRLDVVEVPS